MAAGLRGSLGIISVASELQRLIGGRLKRHKAGYMAPDWSDISWL